MFQIGKYSGCKGPFKVAQFEAPARSVWLPFDAKIVRGLIPCKIEIHFFDREFYFPRVM